jgi:hypothetical protein
MKKGVIFFHSNIRQLYPKRWVDRCINSTVLQRDNDFKIYEINYGGDDYSIFEDINYHQEREFHSKNFSNHAEAMNFIIDRAFEDGCDAIFKNWRTFSRFSGQLFSQIY